MIPYVSTIQTIPAERVWIGLRNKAHVFGSQVAIADEKTVTAFSVTDAARAATVVITTI